MLEARGDAALGRVDALSGVVHYSPAAGAAESGATGASTAAPAPMMPSARRSPGGGQAGQTRLPTNLAFDATARRVSATAQRSTARAASDPLIAAASAPILNVLPHLEDGQYPVLRFPRAQALLAHQKRRVALGAAFKGVEGPIAAIHTVEQTAHAVRGYIRQAQQQMALEVQMRQMQGVQRRCQRRFIEAAQLELKQQQILWQQRELGNRQALPLPQAIAPPPLPAPPMRAVPQPPPLPLQQKRSLLGGLGGACTTHPVPYAARPVHQPQAYSHPYAWEPSPATGNGLAHGGSWRGSSDLGVGGNPVLLRTPGGGSIEEGVYRAQQRRSQELNSREAQLRLMFEELEQERRRHRLHTLGVDAAPPPGAAPRAVYGKSAPEC